MRLRVALTEAEGSNPIRNLTSTVLPLGRALSTFQHLSTGAHTAVGGAQMELELADSLTGERLGAAVDARVGTKTLGGAMDPWSDAKEIMDLWARRLTERMVEARQEAR